MHTDATHTIRLVKKFCWGLEKIIQDTRSNSMGHSQEIFWKSAEYFAKAAFEVFALKKRYSKARASCPQHGN
jgi:hypothetical protein